MARIQWHGDEIASKINEALLSGAEEWLTTSVKTNSVARTPWKEGILAGSHTVQRDDRSVVLGVGGPAAPYATRVHEDADMRHPIGEDHFLEKAANDTVGELPGILQKRLKSIL
jgi:hypothetical protein